MFTPLVFYCSEGSRKVSPWFISPVSNPFLNQYALCRDVPCVNDSGTTYPCDCFCSLSSPIALAAFEELRQLNTRLEVIRLTRPDLTRIISDIDKKNKDGNYLFAIMVGDRMEHLLKRLLDEEEFLSDYGIRSLSKIHQDNPYSYAYKGNDYSIKYEPGESSSAMFGGNSNWRGPIWLPLNYLIINSLRKYHEYYGDKYTYEFPAGSGNKLNLKQIANELTKRILKIFERNDEGAFQYHDVNHTSWTEEHFKEHHLFYEFFHGDTGQGLGASHQTGWSALVVNLLLEMDED